MKKTLVAKSTIPGSERILSLHQGKDDLSISVTGGGQLMSTRKYGSEDALGRLPCQLIDNAESAKVLIGGLEMRFTLFAALAEAGPNARVVVTEIVSEVVEWNKGPFGTDAGRPLDDPRTTI